MKEMPNLPKESAHPTPKTARVAGAWYLLLVVTSVSALSVSGNATSTAGNIRLGLELTSDIVFIFLVRALYGLLKGVNKTLASLMVTLVLVSASISFLDELNQIAAVFNQRSAGQRDKN